MYERSRRSRHARCFFVRGRGTSVRGGMCRGHLPPTETRLISDSKRHSTAVSVMYEIPSRVCGSIVRLGHNPVLFRFQRTVLQSATSSEARAVIVTIPRDAQRDDTQHEVNTKMYEHTQEFLKPSKSHSRDTSRAARHASRFRTSSFVSKNANFLSRHRFNVAQLMLRRFAVDSR